MDVGQAWDLPQDPKAGTEVDFSNLLYLFPSITSQLRHSQVPAPSLQENFSAGLFPKQRGLHPFSTH